MRILKPNINLDDFFARTRCVGSRVLMLDYDGTLAPFCIDPADALPYDGVVPLLDAIQAAGHTRLAIISGRWTQDLLPLIGLRQTPEIWGSHGWERLAVRGEYSVAPISNSALEVLVAADEWIEQVEALGARCERKPAGVAFHWRGLSDKKISEIRTTITENWAELERASSLSWHDFDGGIELRVAGHDKGSAVRTLVAETGPDAVFAYLGDDLTDESAFKAMPEGGVAALVRPEFRPTAANLWLKPPAEVIEFLTRWHEAAAGRP